METMEKKIGSWRTIVSTEPQVLNVCMIKAAYNHLEEWLKVLSPEETFVQQNFGAPSLVVSMNCCINKENKLKIYSINANPNNLGVACDVNVQVRERLNALSIHWPSFNLIDPLPDDKLWHQANNSDLFWHRGLYIERPKAPLANCMSPVNTRNDNSYGEKMGLWKRVSMIDTDSLPWSKGFVFKSIAKRTNDFFIYHVSRMKGGIKEEKVERLLMFSPYYCQDFIMPMPSVIKGESMIYKVFFAYDVKKHDYLYLGGLWLSRNNLRIHGSSETTFGPLK